MYYLFENMKYKFTLFYRIKINSYYTANKSKDIVSLIIIIFCLDRIAIVYSSQSI